MTDKFNNDDKKKEIDEFFEKFDEISNEFDKNSNKSSNPGDKSIEEDLSSSSVGSGKTRLERLSETKPQSRFIPKKTRTKDQEDEAEGSMTKKTKRNKKKKYKINKKKLFKFFIFEIGRAHV